MPHFANKNLARTYAKGARATLSPEEIETKSHAMCERLTTLITETKPRCVFSFYPTAHEPNLTAINGKLSSITFGLPVISGGASMEFYRWQAGDTLLPNRFGIMEPNPLTACLLTPGAADLILVPALLGDLQGHRVGYGAGYYDRFLARYPHMTRILVVYEALIIASVPRESHDLPCQFVLCETYLQKAIIASQ